jgi:hypothetical protein
MSGASLAFSESDLVRCAAAYDPAKHEAPLVVGHPRHDAPAYGWVKSLSAADGALEAAPDRVSAEFAEWVKAGQYTKISASFYTPESPQNPVPGVYYLRHVGFLGAQPPAIKGLRAPEFSDNEEGVIEFADWSDMQNASLWRRMREWIISFRGLDEADKVIPDYAVSVLEDEARKEEPDEPVPSSQTHFQEPIHQEKPDVTPEQKAALEAENASLKTQVAQAAAREKSAAQAGRHGAHLAFAEGLVKEGRLLPAHRDLAVATLDHLTALPAVVEFGEGEAKMPLADALKAFFKAQPKLVEFGEMAGGSGETGSVSFAAPPGYGIDADRMALHAQVLAYQRTHNVSYDLALNALSKA